MRPIPPKLKEDLVHDPWYKRCCITGKTATQGRIEWHHNFIFAGRQVNEKWCILPLLKRIHAREKEQTIGARLDWIMLNRANQEELKKYSLQENKKKLNEMFGDWDPYGRYEL